jgi:prephenate dehydrogenase
MTVGIVGLGLIGGSVGLALRDPSRTILGYDPSPEACRIAESRFCVDQLASLAETAQADLVFVAAPPAAVVSVLDQVFRHKRPETVVTDCTSVKADVVAWAEANRAASLVPGHPMAGHEKTSAAYASAWMFRGARWILTPVDVTQKAALREVEKAVKAMGAVPVRVDPARHDRQVAVLSHLPHALAAVLVNLGEELERTDVAAGSWRDLTRVGGVDPDLWSQILLGNRREVAQVLGDAERQLAELRAALDADDAKAVRAYFERARIAKRKQEA